MGKSHRGAGIRSEYPKMGRGKCAVTNKTGVKLLYEVEIDGKKVMVSKTAKATLTNAKRRQEREEKRKQRATENAET